MKSGLIASCCLLLTTWGATGHAMVQASSCAEGLRMFPRLKALVAELGDKDFTAHAVRDGSKLFGWGLTLAGPDSQEAWEKDSVTLPLEWKKGGGKLELSMVGKAADRDGGAWAAFWSLLTTPAEIELLSGCTVTSCKIKFNDTELKTLHSLPAEKRPTAFREIVKARMDALLQSGKIFSYEKTTAPLSLAQAVPDELEKVREYSVLSLAPPVGKRTESWGFETLDAEPGRHKPVVGLFERVCHPKDESGGVSCEDLVVYSNHYFDFWARKVTFFPWCGSRLVFFYEIAEEDDLKSKSIFQILSGLEMRKLVEYLVETRLRRIHMLGSQP